MRPDVFDNNAGSVAVARGCFNYVTTTRREYPCMRPALHSRNATPKMESRRPRGLIVPRGRSVTRCVLKHAGERIKKGTFITRVQNHVRRCSAGSSYERDFFARRIEGSRSFRESRMMDFGEEIFQFVGLVEYL